MPHLIPVGLKARCIFINIFEACFYGWDQMSYGSAIWHCGTQEDNSKRRSIEAVAVLALQND